MKDMLHDDQQEALRAVEEAIAQLQHAAKAIDDGQLAVARQRLKNLMACVAIALGVLARYKGE